MEAQMRTDNDRNQQQEIREQACRTPRQHFPKNVE
jgi:hypothetical protein